MIAKTFDEWENCIINDCGIPLTKDFALKRLKVYNNPRNPETKKFVELYGQQHLDNIIYWFTKASR